MFTLYAIFALITFALLYGVMHGLFPRTYPFWKCALLSMIWPGTWMYVFTRWVLKLLF